MLIDEAIKASHKAPAKIRVQITAAEDDTSSSGPGSDLGSGSELGASGSADLDMALPCDSSEESNDIILQKDILRAKSNGYSAHQGYVASSIKPFRPTAHPLIVHAASSTTYPLFTSDMVVATNEFVKCNRPPFTIPLGYICPIPLAYKPNPWFLAFYNLLLWIRVSGSCWATASCPASSFLHGAVGC